MKKQNDKSFPKRFPFWARFKKNKNRTTLVVDEDKVYDKKKKKEVDGFVHREATHSFKKDYERISPNPDKSDNRDMYLKRPTKHPKDNFGLHNKNLDMPDYLRKRYKKNNKKKS